ncbi:MAG: hypothetical protein V2A73_09360 [Pseudomonadota bacterium]
MSSNRLDPIGVLGSERGRSDGPRRGGGRGAAAMVVATIASAVLLFAGVEPAWGQGQPSPSARELAKRHYADGASFFEKGSYKEALAEFQAADALAPAPLLSYNIGLCYEKLDQPELALTHYRAYLGRTPDALNRAAVESRIAQIEARLAGDQAPSSRAAGGVAASPAGESAGTAAASESSGLTPAGTPNPSSPASTSPSTSPSPSTTAPAPGSSSSPRATAATKPPVARPARPVPAQSPPPEPAKPVYKSWPFLVIAAVVVVIAFDVLSGGDDHSDSSPPREPASGGILLRF